MKSFSGNYTFLFVSTGIIILALTALFFLTMHQKKLAMQRTTPLVTPTEAVTPMTRQNAQPTIDTMEQDMQQALNQASSDSQTVGQINGSDDNVTGL